MDRVCQKCGVRGYAEALVFCNICKRYAEHKYCMYELPDLEDRDITWSCEECTPRNDFVQSCPKMTNPAKTNSSAKRYRDRDIHFEANDRNAPVVTGCISSPSTNLLIRSKEQLKKKRGLKVQKRRKLLSSKEDELERKRPKRNSKNTRVMEKKHFVTTTNKGKITSPNSSKALKEKGKMNKEKVLVDKNDNMVNSKASSSSNAKMKRKGVVICRRELLLRDGDELDEVPLSYIMRSLQSKENVLVGKSLIGANDQIAPIGKLQVDGNATNAPIECLQIGSNDNAIIGKTKASVQQNDRVTPVGNKMVDKLDQTGPVGETLVNDIDQNTPATYTLFNQIGKSSPFRYDCIAQIDKSSIVEITQVDKNDQIAPIGDPKIDESYQKPDVITLTDERDDIAQIDKSSIVETTQVDKNDQINPVVDPKMDKNHQKPHVIITLTDEIDDFDPVTEPEPEPSHTASQESVIARPSLSQNEFGITYDSMFYKKNKWKKTKTKRLIRVSGQTSKPTDFDSKSRKVDYGQQSKGKGQIHGNKNHARRNYTDQVHRPSRESTLFFAELPLFNYAWSGCLEIAEKIWGPLGGHTSFLACEKERGHLKMFPRVICMEKVYSPKLFETRLPKNRDVDVFFFPEHSRVEEAVDELMRDMIEGNYALKFSLDDAEFFIFSSSIFPEHSQKFHGRFYLWGLFKPRRLKSSQEPPIHASLNSNHNQNQNQTQAQNNMRSAREENVEELHDPNQGEFQQVTENIEICHCSNHEEFQQVIVNIEELHDSSQEEFQQVTDATEKRHEEFLQMTEYVEKRQDFNQEEFRQLTDNKRVTIDFISQENKGDGTEECLNLFPEWSEDMAVRSKDRISDMLKLELELGI